MRPGDTVRVRLDCTRFDVQHAAGEEAHVTKSDDAGVPLGQPYPVYINLIRTGERLRMWSDELEVVRAPIH